MSQHLRGLSQLNLVEKEHIDYLTNLSKQIQPAVIYDIGSCVGEYSRLCKRLWPNAKVIAFDALAEAAPLYADWGIDFYIATLGAMDGAERNFWYNEDQPFGNSLYRENPAFSGGADHHYGEERRRVVKTVTIDSLVKEHNLPLPTFIKMDVQGAELDILDGATNVLTNVTDMILEIQDVPYNMGAPLLDVVVTACEDLGFKLVGQATHRHWAADYHFRKSI